MPQATLAKSSVPLIVCLSRLTNVRLQNRRDQSSPDNLRSANSVPATERVCVTQFWHCLLAVPQGEPNSREITLGPFGQHDAL